MSPNNIFSSQQVSYRSLTPRSTPSHYSLRSTPSIYSNSLRSTPVASTTPTQSPTSICLRSYSSRADRSYPNSRLSYSSRVDRSYSSRADTTSCRRQNSSSYRSPSSDRSVTSVPSYYHVPNRRTASVCSDHTGSNHQPKNQTSNHRGGPSKQTIFLPTRLITESPPQSDISLETSSLTSSSRPGKRRNMVEVRHAIL